MRLEGKTVLVTGATGFIGGRLVERLLLEEGACVRALVRNYARAAWLSRTTVDMVLGDVINPEGLGPALEGCDVVFHCAALLGGDPEMMHQVNVVGTENLLAAARDVGVSRFVYVSSLAVHGRRFPDGLDEHGPVHPGGDPYAETKLAAERLVLHYAQQYDLPVVILRPTIVYGPRSQWWTVDPIQRIKQDQLALPGHGAGVANLVYVDDVVNALILAAVKKGVEGEVFLISAEERVTWGEFLGAYAVMLDRELPCWPVPVASMIAVFTDSLNRAIDGLDGGRGRAEVLRLVMAVGLRGLRKLAGSLYKLGRWEVEMYGQRAQVSVSKARDLLGYHSDWSLSRSMAETRDWLQAQGYLPADDTGLK